MAFAPIAFIAPNYKKFPNFFLKFYQSGSTTNPLTISDGGSPAVFFGKAEIDSDGFITTDGTNIFIPFLDQKYDAYLFPTAQEANDNDTANATRIAQGISPLGDNFNFDVIPPFEFVATAGQTIFDTTLEFNAATVHSNGALIPPSDYTIIDSPVTPNANAVEFATPRLLGEQVIIYVGNPTLVVSGSGIEGVNVSAFGTDQNAFAAAQTEAVSRKLSTLYWEGENVFTDNFHLANGITLLTHDAKAVITARAQDPSGDKFDSPIISGSGADVKAVVSAGTNVRTNHNKILANDTSLGIDIRKIDLTVDPASLGIKVGDVICLISDVDYSFGNFIKKFEPSNYALGDTVPGSDRPEYRQGEFIEVRALSATEVFLVGNLLDKYLAADTNLFTFDNVQNNIIGGTIIGIDNDPVSQLDVVWCFYGSQMRKSRFDNCELKDATNHCFGLNNAYDVQINGVTVTKPTFADGVGLHYGMQIANSQNVTANGIFFGSRHGVTVGGSDQDMSIVNSFIRVGGIIGGYRSLAADWHGNTRYCEYYGLIKGGVTWNGSLNSCAGAIITPNHVGLCIEVTELVGGNQNFSNFTILPTGAQTSTALIDLGGISDRAFGPAITEGGTCYFQDIKVFWDKQETDSFNIISIRNRGCTQPIKIVISNVDGTSSDIFNYMLIDNPGAPVGAPAGIQFEDVVFNDCSMVKGGFRIEEVDNLTMNHCFSQDSDNHGIELRKITNSIMIDGCVVERSGLGPIRIAGDPAAKTTRVTVQNTKARDGNLSGFLTDNTFDSAISITDAVDVLYSSNIAERTLLNTPAFDEVVWIVDNTNLILGSENIIKLAGVNKEGAFRDNDNMTGIIKTFLIDKVSTDTTFRMGHMYNVDTTTAQVNLIIENTAFLSEGSLVRFIDKVANFATFNLVISETGIGTIEGAAAPKTFNIIYTDQAYKYDKSRTDLRVVNYL